MEFIGRIAKILPKRSGTSQRTGNEWQALPFVFEYFEHETDRWSDKVLLETFDTKVIDNLKEGMEVRCGFGHNVETITKTDGTTTTFNKIRLYKIECVRKTTAQQSQYDGGTLSDPAPAASTAGTAPQPETGDTDDLPF